MSPAEPDLALISELLELTERNSQAQEPHILLMQHYALCGWHEEAKEEAHLALRNDSTAKEAQIFLENLSNGSTKPAKKSFSSKNKPRDTRISREQSDQTVTWRPSLFPIVSPEASYRELAEGEALP